MRFQKICVAALAAGVFACAATGASAADKAGCKSPGWAAQRLPGFAIDDCSDRNSATLDIDSVPQPRTVYGHRNYVHFAAADSSKPGPNATTWLRFFVQQAQKAGAKLISDPQKTNYAALDAKTPQGEWIYAIQSYGPSEGISAYDLTTVLVRPMPLQGQGAAMKTALDPFAPCASPPWYAKAIPHFTVSDCDGDGRFWDSVDIDTAKGTQTIEGPRTYIDYKLDNDINGIPNTEFQKDFIAIFRQMGATVVSAPSSIDSVVATQKTPVGEFWYRAQHSGPDDTTQAFELTTIQVMPLPQIVQTKAVAAALDTNAPCADPAWLVKNFPQYKRDSCDNLARDSRTVNLATGGQKALEGPRMAVNYTLSDQKKIGTQKGMGRSFMQAFKAMGATLMSDPNAVNEVVAMQKAPAGEFWLIYNAGSGNDENVGGFTLTTFQITAFNQVVKVKPMTAALDIAAKCSDPPWLVQQFPQYKLDSCQKFPWDATTFHLPAGDKPVAGSKTVVAYTLTDPKQDQTAATVKKNYAEAFKAIGDQPQSDPNNNSTTIATQKNAAGEFWFEYDHGSGNDESTGSYSVTTVDAVPFPQVVQVQAMPQGLDPQSKPPCKNPSWLVKQFAYYAISQCSGRDFDQITIDLPSGKKTLVGRILVTDYSLSDLAISPTPEYVYKNYADALHGLGTELVSDPADHKKAVWTQKTPQGEFWYMYSDSGGNDESEGSYELTSVQIGGPPPKTCTLEIYGVNFDFNKATLRPESDPVLAQVAAIFTSDPSYAAEVSGHTDNIGTESYNMKLSAARAAAVKTWLAAHGVAAARMTTQGYGDTRPLVPNTTDANRFKNRRVELKRQNCK